MKPHTPSRHVTRRPASPPVAPLAPRGRGLRAVDRQSCAPLHFASRIAAPRAPVIACLCDTNEVLPKKLTCSKQSRKHFLFDTLGSYFLHPTVATNAAHRHPERSEGSLPVFLQPLLHSFATNDSAAIFTRSNGSTRTLRMLLINEPAIRIVRNSLKTNNGSHF